MTSSRLPCIGPRFGGAFVFLAVAVSETPVAHHRAMTQHRARRPYSPAYARRKLASAEATLTHWQSVQPRDWRERADQHQALMVWGAAVRRWRAIVEPPREVELLRLPF